jgi:hypothetical protein
MEPRRCAFFSRRAMRGWLVVFASILVGAALVSATWNGPTAITTGFGGGAGVLAFDSDWFNGCSPSGSGITVTVVGAGWATGLSGSGPVLIGGVYRCLWSVYAPGYAGAVPSSALMNSVVQSTVASVVTYVNPTISSVAPTYIHDGTGATLSISGAYFKNIAFSSVELGWAPNDEFVQPITVVSDTLCTVAVPPGAFTCTGCNVMLIWGWGLRPAGLPLQRPLHRRLADSRARASRDSHILDLR